MNKKEVKKAIARNMFQTFTGTSIQLQKGEKILLEDLISIVRRLEHDKNAVTPYELGRLQGTLEINQNGLAINWLLVADNQGNLLTAPDTHFDAGIMHALQEKLSTASNQVVKSIDSGNELAGVISKKRMSADEMLQVLKSSPNETITRNVAFRAGGPQVAFAFAEGERQLGGNLDIQKEFTNSETVAIKRCRALRWTSEKEIKLRLESAPEDHSFLPFIIKNEMIVRVQRYSPEGAIMDCALFADVAIDIAVSKGLLLKKGKQVIQLAKVHDHLAIHNAAQVRLNDLLVNIHHI